MNTTKYLQTDSRWSELAYPKSPCTIGNSGCGEVSIVNAIIEMQAYAKYTPATIQPYCKQFADPSCEGTYHSAIPKMMARYGLTDVKEHNTMPELFKELAKGDRVAIYLMGKRPGGSKRVHWSSGGHFVCSTAYKFKDNKNYVYVKDSYSNSKDRNGWITYEENMKGDVARVWSGKLNGKLTEGNVVTEVKGTSKLDLDNGKIAVDGIGGKQTVLAMQKFFGTTQDGVITGQLTKFKALYPALQSVEFGKGGSQCIAKMQTWLGLSDPDGYIGSNTTKAWQRKLVALGYLGKNETIDGIIGTKTMKAWQECLNNNGKPKTNPTPTRKSYKVIDVSVWQGDIDWKKVKADGIVGAIIRYADGDTLDSKFDANMKNAKANGLHIGAYIFSRATTKAQAEKEAQRLFDACKKYNPDMPLYIDLEAKGLEKYADTVAQAFLNKIKALGGKGGVYANLNWWNNYLKKTREGSFALWVAQYNDTLDYKPTSDVGMWQYSSKGKVNGIKGNVDMDKCYVEYWKDVKPTPTPTPAKKTVAEKSIEWAKKISKEGFDYLLPQAAGCYFCGTTKKKAYTCMPFITACYAHGGGDPDVLKMCQSKHSFSLRDDDSDWKMLIKKGKFKMLGRCKDLKCSDIKPGDIIVQYASDDNHGHMVMYVGDDKMAEAIPSKGCTISNGAKAWFEKLKAGASQMKPSEGAKNFVMRYVGDSKPTPNNGHYTGKYPTLTLKKTYAQAMADTVEWAKWISNGNDFHYGYGAHAHHNGCYFCGTQPASKKNAGIKMWETTYCCNPFVTAALGHGGCIPTMLKLCSNGKSWVEKNFKNSTIFDNLGKPNKSSLKAGDVLCCLNGHVMLYIGDGKLAEAANGDDNVPYSKSWNDSISVSALNNTRWNNKSYGVKSVFRYNGSVDTVAPLKCGEISDRVKDLNDFLKWCGYKVEQGRIFKALTRNAVKEFQKLNGLEADGIVGKATIDAMQKYVKK